MKVRTTYHAELARKESFINILDSLKGRRKTVFECILHNFPVTDKQIAELTGIPINIVPARRKELQGFRWEYVASKDKSEYVHYPDLEYIEFHSFVSNQRRECLWKPTDKAVILEPELIFEY